MRTCIGCRKKKEKDQLTRLIVGKNNQIIIDKKKDKGQRGVYLCSEKCLPMAKERQAFRHAFKKKVKVGRLWLDKKLKRKLNPAPLLE